MLSLFTLFVIIIFKTEAQDLDNDPVVITFKIQSEVFNKSATNIICDHTDYDINKYTVLEGKEFQIYTKYNSYINYVICRDYFNANEISPFMVKIDSKEIIIFKAERTMSRFWKCTVLLHHDQPSTYPKVQYKDGNYTAAYCYMRIRVRLSKSPQTILVNNMELQTVRTDLLEKDVDFTVEYHYADGDIANVTCVDLLNRDSDQLTMQLSMEGTITDKLRIYDINYKVVGFIANLHSGHNNSYMLCNKGGDDDTTTVMVRFVMRTEFNIISVRINGMAVRPLKIAENYYEIKYKYESLHFMNVVCEVLQTDLELAVTGDAFLLVNSYNQTELIPRKKAEMSFFPNRTDYNALSCVVSNYISGAITERIMIVLTAGNFPMKQYSLHITSNGTSMDSYISDREIKYIYYEYTDGEILQLQCGPLLRSNGTLHFGDHDACSTVGCTLSKSLKLSRRDNDSVLVCSLQARYQYYDFYKTLSQIRLILRVRLLPTSSITTLTAADPGSSATSTSNTLLYCGSAAGVAVIAILVVGGYWTVKKRYSCVRSTSQELRSMSTPRPDPASIYYQNLRLSIFKPINERETAEMEMENIYEEFQ